jgi:hypothetical protein
MNRSSPRTVLWLALVISAAGQLYWTATGVHELLERTAERARLFDPDEEPSPALVHIAAYRSLLPLVELLPPDAKVLLVVNSPFEMPYEFYLLPRPLRILQRFEQEHLDFARSQGAALAETAERYHAALEERGHLLTPAGLRDGLAWADWVVVLFGGDPPPQPPFVPVRTHEQARLFRRAGAGAVPGADARTDVRAEGGPR